MASALAGDDLARSSGRRSWSATSFREVWQGQPPEAFTRSGRPQDADEQLQWAALERLPMFDRLRKVMLITQVLDNGTVVHDEVDVTKLGMQEKKVLMDRILKVVEEDNEKFLQKLRDRTDRVGDSFSTQITAILGLLITAFSPLIQFPVLSPPLRSFMSSTYTVLMIVCAIPLVANISLRGGGGVRFQFHRSEIMRTSTILTGSLAIISLISISKPYIALVSLLVWLFVAMHLIHRLIRVLNQPILPIAINPNYANTVFGMMKNWATNLFHRCTRRMQQFR